VAFRVAGVERDGPPCVQHGREERRHDRHCPFRHPARGRGPCRDRRGAHRRRAAGVHDCRVAGRRLPGSPRSRAGGVRLDRASLPQDPRHCEPRAIWPPQDGVGARPGCGGRHPRRPGSGRCPVACRLRLRRGTRSGRRRASGARRAAAVPPIPRQRAGETVRSQRAEPVGPAGPRRPSRAPAHPQP